MFAEKDPVVYEIISSVSSSSVPLLLTDLSITYLFRV